MLCHKESRVDPDLGRESDCEAGNRIPTFCEVWDEINDSSNPWLGTKNFWKIQVYIGFIQIATIAIPIANKFFTGDIKLMAQMEAVVTHLNLLNLPLHTAVTVASEVNRLYLIHFNLLGLMVLGREIPLVTSVKTDPIVLIDICLSAMYFITWVNYNMSEKFMYIRNMDNVIRFRDVNENALYNKLICTWLLAFVVTIAFFTSAWYVDSLTMDIYSNFSFAFTTIHEIIYIYLQIYMYLLLERKKRHSCYLLWGANRFEARKILMSAFLGGLCKAFYFIKSSKRIIIWLNKLTFIIFNIHLWYYAAHELNVFQEEISHSHTAKNPAETKREKFHLPI